jgi:NADH-quinone oxidoreductase subunit K
MIFLQYFFIFSFLLFLIGLWGVLLIKNNLFFLFLAFEILFLGLSLAFIGSSIYFYDLFLQLLIFYLILIFAIESAVGLSLVIIYFKYKGSITYDYFHQLKG